MKKTLLFFAKIIVSVALVLWLIERVDWPTVGEHLLGVSWWLLILYVALQLTGNLISVSNWRNIAGYKGLSFTVKEGFFAFMTGAFINNFLPSTIGGDAYRGLWLAGHTGAKAASLSTVVFHRFIGLWTTALLAVIFSLVLVEHISGSLPLFVTLLVLVAFLVIDLVITLFFRCAWFQRFIEWIPFRKVRRLFDEVVSYTKKGIWIDTGLRAALFAFVGVGLTNYTLFHALGSTVAFVPFLSAVFLVVIVSSVPISIGNIGIKEWAYITFFGLIGISAELAVTVALLSRFIQMIISFVALPHYLADREDKR
jgi:hypothetical protein